MHVSGPAGYAYFAGYPAKDAIFSEEGTASFQHRMKRGYILMVNGKSYSCGSPYAGSNPDCFASLEEHQRLVGKTISVAWFLWDCEMWVLQRLKGIFKKIGNRNGVRLMFLLGYLLAFGIPFAYAYLAKPPAESDMRVSEGTAHFQYRIKRGYMLMVDGHDYTCGGQYLNANPDCFNDGRTRHVHLEGKTVKVVWFAQAAPVFGEVRRVADILHEGVSQLPPGYLKRTLEYERTSATEDALITFTGMLLILLFYEWMDRIRMRNERRFG